jgi:hypothetical protein
MALVTRTLAEIEADIAVADADMSGTAANLKEWLRELYLEYAGAQTGKGYVTRHRDKC